MSSPHTRGRGWSPVPELADGKPWYRHFWPWFLILIPLGGVIGGITTLFIAMDDPDGLVADDYYKRGLAINRDLAREQHARELGLAGRLDLDLAGGELRVATTPVLDLPALRLRLAHATRAQRDQELVLGRAADGHYAGRLPGSPLSLGAWNVQIESAEEPAWRIAGRLYLNRDSAGTLRTELVP